MNNRHAAEACPEREVDLQKYLFDELDSAGRARIEKHLQECAGCRQALHEARIGLDALQGCDAAPAPFPAGSEAGESGGTGAEEAWREFLRRNLRRESLSDDGPGTSASSAIEDAATTPFRMVRPGYLRPLAAAALLLIGLGLGRWMIPPAPAPAAPVPAAVGEETVLEVEADAVDALMRAELLADLGISWVEDVLGLVGTVMEIEPAVVRAAELERLRSTARRLIQDGRLLTRRLDPERDAVFLAAIGRAEFILEDVAGIGIGDEADWSLGQIRNTLTASNLDNRLVALDMDAAVTDALEASGWIGEEYRSELMTGEVRR